MKKIFLILILPSLLFALETDQEEILKAMKDELNRSMNIKLEDYENPYYIEYRLKIREINSASATLGQITDTNQRMSAVLTVDVRIGDYKFDNTNFFDVGLGFFGSSDDEERFKNRSLPIEINYDLLRKNLWLATDAAYKQSLEIFSKKKATISNRNRKDTTHDFMRVEPKKNYLIEKQESFNKTAITNMLKSVSATFRNYPDIMVSSAGVEYIPETEYYVNSEGMEYVKTESYVGFEMVAFTMAEDGMPLADFYSAYAEYPSELPNQNELKNAADDLAKTLTKQSKAEILEEPYSGPVLFTEQAAAELYSQVFAPNFITQRNVMTEGGVSSNERFTAFQMKVGGRVMPDHLSVKDLPNLDNFNGNYLFGHYDLDENGIKPKDVLLVENGYLKTLLSERIPTRRIRENTGHKRGGAAMYSTQQIIPDEARMVSQDSLEQKMIELIEARELPYALIVDRIMNSNILITTLYRTCFGAYPIPRGDGNYAITRLYKLYPDGRKELVRGGDGAGITYQSFRDVILTGENPEVYNFLAPSVISPFMTGGSQYVGSTIITPKLLFEDAEIRTMDQDFKKPPFLDNPLSTN